MTRFKKMEGYPDEIRGRFNSFIATQFDDSLSVEMQMRSLIKWAIDNFKEMDQTYNDFTEYVVQGNLNPFIQFLNDLIEYMNEFVDTFDTKLQDEILFNLQKWNDDGTLETLINESLDTKYNEMDQRLTTQLAQTVHDLSLKRDKSTPIGLDDASADLLSAIDGGTGATVEVLSIPRDYSVTPKKTTFFTNDGKNLFNKDDITVGKYVNYSNGLIGDLASYGVTDFIEVLPNTTYNKTVTQQFAFYDENKDYISGLDLVKRFTTPSNCKYIRMNFELKDLDKNIQLELGPGATTYEPYKPVLMNNRIKDFDKLVRLTHGKNLFDKSKAQPDKYISSDGGVGDNIGFWATDYIELQEGKTYIKTGNMTYALYDNNKQFVTGSGSGTTFTVPSGVKYGRFTVIDKDNYSVDTFQLEEGSVATEYEPYKLILDNELLPSNSGGAINYVKVAKSGADFTSIGEALNSTSGDIAIKVLQGTYYEHLDINATNRKVSIIGVDVENTIIRDDSGDYYKAPLNANGNIYAENITFLSTHDDGTDYTIPAYAVHLDRSGSGVATFRNCKMVSYQNSGVGIGTHQDQTIILDGCEIVKISEYNGGALYIHNAQASNVTNQKVITKNCLIKTNVGFVIKVDDSNTSNGGTNSPMDITFQFNILDSDTLTKDQRVWYRDTPINDGVSGQIKLTSDSFGNNDVKLNA